MIFFLGVACGIPIGVLIGIVAYIYLTNAEQRLTDELMQE